MAHTPAPDPTLTAEQLAHRQDVMVAELRHVGTQRALIPGLPDQLDRLHALRDSNAEIRQLADEAHEQLGMSLPQIAAALGFASRQALHNIRTGKTAV